jgi:hypothetical protein
MGGSLHIVKKNREDLEVASREQSLEVNAEKLSVWPSLEIRMQDRITKQRLVIQPLRE